MTEQVEIDGDALTYLAENGFTPGTAARIKTKAPDGTLVLDLAKGSSRSGRSSPPALRRRRLIADQVVVPGLRTCLIDSAIPGPSSPNSASRRSGLACGM